MVKPSSHIFFFPLILLCCKTPHEYSGSLAPAALIYMIADNNLDYYAISNIRQMEQGISDDRDGVIFVFIDRGAGNPSHPYLMRIERNTESDTITSPILQVYQEKNSCDPDFLRQVIADVKSYSARQKAELRRLVLWSHGTGWLPEGAPFNEIDDEDENIKTHKMQFSFGLDNKGADDEILYKKEMNIKELSAALHGERFELLILDACFMGSIETVYELRNTCDYLLVSPSEILSSGFPYKDIINDLAYKDIEPLAIAVKFHSYYSGQKNALQSAAISVIDTRGLPGLADKMIRVYDDYFLYRDEIRIDELLHYDRTASNYFFDLKDFVVLVSKKTGETYNDLLDHYKKTVPFYLHTSKMFDTLDLAGTSGLSVYIPNTFTTRSGLHEYYHGLEWTRDSRANLLFD
ncbi:MAG: hypothetical protein LBU18_01680 [Treponema sp.]|nr:hypothetical protein [Treponema sp.]